MARSSYLDHLASVSLFSACSKQDLQAVARASDELNLAEGRTLCEQGRVGQEAFVILEGTADVIRGSKKIATLGPGSCFGELALLDDVPPIARKLLKSLATRIRELDAKTFD
jgi:CRP/FNR family cyclic AMP-dependent transcriptional regulator